MVKLSKQERERSRGWCLTMNNWNDDHLAMLMALYEECDNCTYVCIGFEKGAKKGVPHIQGYAYFREAVSFNTVSLYLPGFHIEAQKSRLNVKAYCYCMEEGDFVELGETPRQGHRTDLEVIRQYIESGVSIDVIKKRYFSQWIYHRRAFEEYINRERERKCTKADVYVVDMDDPDEYEKMRELISFLDKGRYIIMDNFDIGFRELLKYRYNGMYTHVFVLKQLWESYLMHDPKNVNKIPVRYSLEYGVYEEEKRDPSEKIQSASSEQETSKDGNEAYVRW